MSELTSHAKKEEWNIHNCGCLEPMLSASPIFFSTPQNWAYSSPLIKFSQTLNKSLSLSNPRNYSLHHAITQTVNNHFLTSSTIHTDWKKKQRYGDGGEAEAE